VWVYCSWTCCHYFRSTSSTWCLQSTTAHCCDFQEFSRFVMLYLVYVDEMYLRQRFLHLRRRCSQLGLLLDNGDRSKTAKIIKRCYYSPTHRLNINVMLIIITVLMIFAVFDPSPLTLWINCSFRYLYFLFHCQICVMCHCVISNNI